MMYPIRLSIVTYNLWNVERWPERAPALKKFINSYRPDLLCIQELHKETQTFLDELMLNHTRIYDDFLGWTNESNIYWNTQLFEEVEHGTEDIGLTEKYRRLFWVRLKFKNRNQTLFISTAHLTYQEHPNERETAISPRINQAKQIVAALKRLVQPNEPAFIMGDFNDTIHPILILHDAGYKSCFSVLDLPYPPTFPCYPTARNNSLTPSVNQTRDWIVSNSYAYPIAAQIPYCYEDDLAPSDHWPILAVYEFGN